MTDATLEKFIRILTAITGPCSVMIVFISVRAVVNASTIGANAEDVPPPSPSESKEISENRVVRALCISAPPSDSLIPFAIPEPKFFPIFSPKLISEAVSVSSTRPSNAKVSNALLMVSARVPTAVSIGSFPVAPLYSTIRSAVSARVLNVSTI